MFPWGDAGRGWRDTPTAEQQRRRYLVRPRSCQSVEKEEVQIGKKKLPMVRRCASVSTLDISLFLWGEQMLVSSPLHVGTVLLIYGCRNQCVPGEGRATWHSLTLKKKKNLSWTRGLVQKLQQKVSQTNTTRMNSPPSTHGQKVKAARRWPHSGSLRPLSELKDDGPSFVSRRESILDFNWPSSPHLSHLSTDIEWNPVVQNVNIYQKIMTVKWSQVPLDCN